MFNESQEKAVDYEKGAAMVLAGPGTGKTTVITHRIKRLIEKRLALPEEILVVTFTKAAATEMQERFIKIMEHDERCNNVCFGTFHSIFLAMLRESNVGVSTNQILSEGKRNAIIKEIIMRFQIEVPDMWEFVRMISGEISKVKGIGSKIEDYKDGGGDRKSFIKIYDAYEKELKAENMIDFDDMILKSREMLLKNPDVLAYWKSRYKYILVDEFQDINQMQYENIKMLAGVNGNIFVVGDDDQSIYGFRGSNPEIMFAFQRDFQNVKIINLDINYRSNIEILEASQNLIYHNRRRFGKKITSENGTGGQVEIKEFDTNISEYKYIGDLIQKYIKEGTRPKDIAILVRNHSGMSIVRNCLSNINIATKEKNINPIYSNRLVRDIVSYVRASQTDSGLNMNPELISIINKPERFISRQVISECGFKWKEIKNVYTNSLEVLKNINELEMHLKLIRQLEPFAAVNYIRYGVNYEKYMKEYAVKNKLRFVDVEHIYETVKREASKFKSNKEWLEFIDGNKKIVDETHEEAVSIITMHASKGLEYKVVFLPDVNQGVIPSAKSLRNMDVSEERRIFYVALTRASKKLHVYSVKNEMGRKCNKSQFINEMCSCLQF